MIIDNIDPKTVRSSVGLMLREERLARGLSFEQAADAAREALLQKQSRREYLETQAQLARALTRLRVKHHSENLD